MKHANINLCQHFIDNSIVIGQFNLIIEAKEQLSKAGAALCSLCSCAVILIYGCFLKAFRKIVKSRKLHFCKKLLELKILVWRGIVAWLREWNVLWRVTTEQMFLSVFCCHLVVADFGVSAQITATMCKRKSFIGTPYWWVKDHIALSGVWCIECGHDGLCPHVPPVTFKWVCFTKLVYSLWIQLNFHTLVYLTLHCVFWYCYFLKQKIM